MRRAFAIAALAAMMLALGDPAMAQSPKAGRPPNAPLIKPSQALIIAQRMVPNSKAVGVKLLPGGNYAVTLRRNNQVQRVIIDGDTGAPR